MKDKKVMFKQVVMDGQKITEQNEIEGLVIDDFIDSRVKNGKMVEIKYYLIADENGKIHQVRPFNVMQIIA